MCNNRRALLLLTAMAAFSGTCTTLAGCQSVFGGRLAPNGPEQAAAQKPADTPAASLKAPVKQGPPTPVVIGPRSRVDWSIEVAGGQPHDNMNGHEVVGPDGTLLLGPYGTVRVNGMNPNQAAAAVQTQVRSYVKAPKVRIRVLPPEDAAVAAAPAAPANGAVEWTSDEKPSQIVAAGWKAAPRPGEVVLASSGPDLTLMGDGPPSKDGPPGKDGPPSKDGPLGAKKDRTPPAKGDDSQEPVYAAMPPHPGPHHDPHHLPHEGTMVSLAPYRVGPPDILQIESLRGLVTQDVRGPHLIRPDGTVGLGAYGSAYVAGLTIEDAKSAIARVIRTRLDPDKVSLKDVIEGLSVDVLAYNSKVYYVIADNAGNGEQITRLPITGNDKVLDAISQNVVRPGINGLPLVASKHHIWVARPGPDGHEQILPVDYVGITQKGRTETNYQLLPGDRVYVKADCLRTINTAVDKFLSPIERILGVTLLGSEVVNSVRSGTVP